MDKADHLSNLSYLKSRLDLIKEKPGKINTEDIELVYKFASTLASKEYLGGLIQAIVFIGSAYRGEAKPGSDLDVLVIMDDVDNEITSEMGSAYSLTIGSLIAKLNAQDRLHITTLGMLRFWDGVLNGDPVLMTMLRYGKPLVDTGFFKPLKTLLERGLIKSTPESINAHVKMARALLNSTRSHMLAGLADLYWAVVDSVHALIMNEGLEAPYPTKAPVVFARIAKRKRISAEYVLTVKEIVTLMKSITHGKRKELTGIELEKWRKRVASFVTKIESLIG